MILIIAITDVWTDLLSFFLPKWDCFFLKSIKNIPRASQETDELSADGTAFTLFVADWSIVLTVSLSQVWCYGSMYHTWLWIRIAILLLWNIVKCSIKISSCSIVSKYVTHLAHTLPISKFSVNMYTITNILVCISTSVGHGGSPYWTETTVKLNYCLQ